MNFNSVTLAGNVARDPEVRKMPSGSSVASFSVATNQFYTDAQGQKQQRADFHNIVVFGKLADIVERYVSKGGLVLVQGRLQTRSYKNKQDQTVYRTEVVAQVIQLGPKGSAKFTNKEDDIPVIEEGKGTSSESEEIDVNSIEF